MSIHGHEILNHLLQHEPTPEKLKKHVLKVYGPEARFYTCSDEGLSLEELLAFLKERGKYVLLEGKMVADTEKICQHSEE
jgi:probable metal-binding protein